MIEDKAFSPSYDLAPSASSVSKLSLFLSFPVCHLSSLLTATGECGGGGGDGEGAKSYDGENAWWYSTTTV
jgi:hypothetical protein